jgi:hypothetical protein
VKYYSKIHEAAPASRTYYVEGEFMSGQLVRNACVIEDCIAESDLPELDDESPFTIHETLPANLWRRIVTEDQ